MSQPIIIGITGTLGAGKSTVAKYLADNHGFKYFSVRDFLTEEVNRRELPLNRDSLLLVANDLRKTFGASHITEKILEKARKEKKSCVIESIRALHEAQCLKAYGGKLWAIDADIKIRYERVCSRLSSTDRVSFEKFRADEKRESSSSDPALSNVAAAMTIADVLLDNNGDQEDLFEKIDSIVLATHKKTALAR